MTGEQPEQLEEPSAAPVVVTIDTPGVTVTVQAPHVPLQEAADTALDLFRKASRVPQLDPARRGTSIGFTAELGDVDDGERPDAEDEDTAPAAPAPVHLPDPYVRTR